MRIDMQFWLNISSNPVEVSFKQIKRLREKGDIPDGQRCISVDGGDTWLDYDEVVAIVVEEMKMSEDEKTALVAVPVETPMVYCNCTKCGTTLENFKDMVGQTDECPVCGETYEIKAITTLSIPLIIAGAAVLLIVLGILVWHFFLR